MCHIGKYDKQNFREQYHEFIPYKGHLWSIFFWWSSFLFMAQILMAIPSNISTHNNLIGNLNNYKGELPKSFGII